jgi:TolB protein
MIGTREFILPFVGGQAGTPYSQPSLDHDYIIGARAQGGLAGFMHPYQSAPRTPDAAASTLVALDVALGLGDYYDLAALWSDELGSAEFYYRLLNAGFRVAATGGTDNFSDVWRDPPPGSARTFAKIEGRLTLESWMTAIRRGRTFVSTGPLVLMTVAGRDPGDEIVVPANAPAELPGRVEVLSIARIDSLQIVVNGSVVRTVAAGARDSARLAFEGMIPVPEGGWVAARVLGKPSQYLGDDYAFAHTGPVYVVRGGVRYVSRADAEFLGRTVDAIWTRVSRGRWRSDAERDRFRGAVDSARGVYSRLAATGR